jgi:hypothetical protein
MHVKAKNCAPMKANSLRKRERTPLPNRTIGTRCSILHAQQDQADPIGFGDAVHSTTFSNQLAEAKADSMFYYNGKLEHQNSAAKRLPRTGQRLILTQGHLQQLLSMFSAHRAVSMQSRSKKGEVRRRRREPEEPYTMVLFDTQNRTPGPYSAHHISTPKPYMSAFSSNCNATQPRISAPRPCRDCSTSNCRVQSP